jgi:hypothetical protein
MYTETLSQPSGTSGLDILVQVLPFFAVALAVVVVLAFFVARAGGRRADATAVGYAPESAASRSRRDALLTALVVLVATTVGFLTGREIAHEFNAGGFTWFGAILLLFFLAVAVVGLVLIALIAAAFRRGFSLAIGRVLASAALLAVSGYLGNVTAVATGGALPPPVFLTADADVQVRLDKSSVPFVARDAGRAECHSVQDGRDVQEVMAMELGEFGAGTLQATVSIGPSAPDETSIVVAIDQADLAQGTAQPAWQMGPIKTTQFGDRGTTGTLTFELARNLEVEAMSGPPASTDWPVSISGTMRWSCQPW